MKSSETRVGVSISLKGLRLDGLEIQTTKSGKHVMKDRNLKTSFLCFLNSKFLIKPCIFT